MGLTQSAYEFILQTEKTHAPLYWHLKKSYESLPTSKPYVDSYTAALESNFKGSYTTQWLRGFITYKEWATDFGREFIYEKHHGMELEAMGNPQKHYDMWELEIIQFFIKSYSGMGLLRIPKDIDTSRWKTKDLIDYVISLK